MYIASSPGPERFLRSISFVPAIDMEAQQSLKLAVRGVVCASAAVFSILALPDAGLEELYLREGAVPDPRLLELPLCRLNPELCAGKTKLQQQQLAAASRMHGSILHVGGAGLAACCVASLLLGLVLQFWVLGLGAASRESLETRFEAPGGRLSWRWWWFFPCEFSYPTMSMKLWVFALLWAHCHVLMAPRPGVLSTPELVELVARPTPWKYPMLCNKWLLPNLTEKTASGWMEFLSQLRLGMVLSWLGFILLPSSGKDGCLPVFLRAFSGLLYGCGALVYSYLGIITYTYNQKHSEYGTILFALASTAAVPFLETNPLAGAWLRKFLVMCSIIPIYLFAGVCKVRYLGVPTLVTGEWLLDAVTHQAHGFSWLPSLNRYLSMSPWICMFMSWATLVFELILPAIVVATMGPSLHSGSAIRLLYFLGTAMFHVQVFFQLGPNWVVQLLLLLLASDPLALIKGKPPRPTVSASLKKAPCFGDHLRGVLGFLTLAAWFATQFWSDLDHLLFQFPWAANHEPLLPVPEMDMFSPAGAASSYKTSFAVVVLLVMLLLAKIDWDVQSYQLIVRERTQDIGPA
ncbi:unnamed protein product [Effrenium voratum]|nr:unnamed protein product [Effrenium voratum]